MNYEIKQKKIELKLIELIKNIDMRGFIVYNLNNYSDTFFIKRPGWNPPKDLVEKFNDLMNARANACLYTKSDPYNHDFLYD